MWFDDLQFGKDDYPIHTPEYIYNIENMSSLFSEYNLFDYIYGMKRYVKLSELFYANSKSEWEIIRKKARSCESVTILNDLPYMNTELSFIVEFYIKAFYSALKKENSNCYVYPYVI